MSEPHLDETIPLPQGGKTPSGTVPATPATGTDTTRIAPQPIDLVGKQLDDFKVLRRLGAGGMAEVFLAEQLSLKRPVALKVLKQELLEGSDDTHLRRFKQEATAAANLNHAHIVQVYAIGEYKGVHYIAQEYVPGLTLREWLRRNGPPDPHVAIKLIRQVALALQAAADAGIVHRDVKPENILLTKKGDAKVADFGLAQLSQTGERVQLTQVGMTMGTPLYMSPEQVAGKTLDHRSDLYSLGVTAYHLLAGNPPFRGETALSIAVQHLNTPAEPLLKLRPDLPLALCELVEKMMDKRPEHRYQRAADLAEDLRTLGVALKTDPQGAAKKALGAFTTAKPAATIRWPLSLDRFFDWSGRRHVAMLAIAASMILLLSIGIGWAMRPADPFEIDPPAETGPVKLGSAREQYNAAAFAGTAEAFQAVRDHWPKDTYWRPLATIRLALLRLKGDDTAGARQLFTEMSVSAEDWSQANGYAGLAVLAALRGDKAAFERILGNQVAPLVTRDNVRLHSEIWQLLMGIRERQRLNNPTLDSLLDETLPETSEGRR
ncbi:MAG: serine/threonine-protein kinase [Planctomycetaceae bacterium]